MTRDDIFSKIRTVLVDALAVDDDEVSMDSVLTTDLGAESIDFLDIVFKLEQEFGIKIDQGELFPDNVAQDPKYVQNGLVTAEGITTLRARMPHVNLDEFQKDPQITRIGTLFTVETLVSFVEAKLAAK